MAFEALALLASNSNPPDGSTDNAEDSNQDSNFSESSSSNSTIESYKTAEYETDES
jgi:hypothetical protein